MVSNQDVLDIIAAAIEAEKVAADFVVYLNGVVSRKASVEQGSPAYDKALDCFDALNALHSAIAPAFTAYPTPEIFVEDNPPGPNGRMPSRLTRYTQFQQIQDAMRRSDRAYTRANNAWLKVPYRAKADVEAYTIIARYKGDDLPTNVAKDTPND
jgi:hypothetical protein